MKVVSINGGSVKNVSSIPSELFRIRNNKIYYLCHNEIMKAGTVISNNCIYQMNLDGTGNKKLSDKDINYFNVINNNIYLYDTEGKCYIADLQCKNLKLINSDAYVFSDDNKKLYYTDGGRNAIYCMDKDGKNSKVIFDFRK